MNPLLVAICLSAFPANSPKTQPATYAFTTGPLTLTFSRTTGRWLGLALAPQPSNLLDPTEHPSAAQASLTVNGKQLHPHLNPTSIAFNPTTASGQPALTLTLLAKPFTIIETYRVNPDTLRITRTGDWTLDADHPANVTAATLSVPHIRMHTQPDTLYLLPAPWPAATRPFSSLQPGRTQTESSWLTGSAALALVHSPDLGLSLIAGHELLLDGARATVTEHQDAITLTHRFNTIGRMKPGETYRIGIQHIQLVRGDWSHALHALADFSDSLGNGPPSDSPAWLDRAAIYSAYPRGPIGVSFNAGGGFRDYAAYLPYIARLGCNVLWLNPTYTSPPGIYTIRDHRAIAPELGTQDDLHHFVSRAHAEHIRVWLDLVPHGPAKDSPDARHAPPQAWAQDKDGRPHMSWGQNLTGDYTHPLWQQYTADIAAYWVRDFHIDGYRLDCGHGSSGLNWSPDAPHRPSAAGPFGGVMLTQAVRNRIRQIDPNAVIFSETGGPVFFRSADLLYDYPFYLGCRQLTYGLSVDEWIPEMQRWLQLSQLAYPQRSLRGLVRFIENHDTVRSAQFFGIGPAQALTALCVFTRGTPMLYQEQEVGYGPAIRDWLSIRSRLPELHAGAADYIAISSSSPGILAFLRTLNDRAAIVAVNMTNRPVQTTLSWPSNLASKLPVVQSAGSGARLETKANGCQVTIPAYRPIVLALRPEPDPSLKPPSHNASSTSPTTSLVLNQTTTPGDNNTTRYHLRLHPVSTWFVETPEGVLLDEFVDPHRPGPRPTLEPCWHPLQHGLWDGCRFAALGFRSQDGRELRLDRLDLSRLVDVQIQDPSNAGRQVTITLVARDSAAKPFALNESDRPTELQPSAYATENIKGLDLDPFYATLSNRHYRLRLARRHGGTIAGLAMTGAHLPRPPVAQVVSEVYTDWGLYAKGRVFGTREEPRPRLHISNESGHREVTFTGQLRSPSWNSVQRGGPGRPPTHYRLTYRADDSPRLRLTLGVTSSKDRPGVSAFLAYRWEIQGVQSWTVLQPSGKKGGRPGARPGERVFQSAQLGPGSTDWTLVITTTAGDIEVRHPKDAPSHPANTFLLDASDGRMHLFIALLNGGKVPLAAQRELAASVDLQFRPAPTP
ncbi:MAG: hypothetical protein JXQ73_09555 [Phycisphaerae bacterium]|nr:hypothetical protein [Phycisphaerae bacterium]